MLTISKAIKAGQGEYYLSLAGVDDYYTAGHEPPGYWLGLGAVELGLQELVDKDQFRHLLRGLSADGARKLVRNVDAERRAGWDLTWSVPKSVSVAWSQADPVIRQQIEHCLHRAVASGVDYLETVGGVSRRGEDGHIHESARLILGAFLHSTSRAQDPQLHVHTLLLNVGVRRDGTTGTLEPRGLYRHQMAAGALFRAELAALLESELGLRSRREGRSFELLGVDTGLMAHFSKRRAAIEAELARTGSSGARAAEMANFATRQKKESRPREELFAEWQQIGRDHHWTAKELSWLIHAGFPVRDPEEERRSVAIEAMAMLTNHESHFSQRQVVQAMAECCQGRALNAEAALRLTDLMLRSPELVRLCEYRGEIQFTTREILALERAILARAESMQRREVPVSTAAAIDEAVARHPQLGAQQREALRLVCSGAGGLSLVQGMAGTGKSSLFAAARELWAEQGRVVYGAALSGKAAKGSATATGIECTTVHRLVSLLRGGGVTLDRGSVVLLDEASMIGTRQLAEIVAACSQGGASLVLCGDSRQLQAIELGGVFAELCRRYESVSLTEIHRQCEPWAREAVMAFAEGRAEAALLPYHQRGLICEARDHALALERLLEDWSKVTPSDAKEQVILAGTVGDVAEINRRVQESLRRPEENGDDRSVRMGQ
jgi:conjugative relaxase-like TrwC/TraI family protein